MFLPSLFSAVEVAVLRSGAARIMARQGPEVVCEADSKTVRLVYGAHRFDEAFVRLGRHPRLIAAAEQLLETDGVYVHQSRLNPKAAFNGGNWDWHQDFATWHDRDGMAEPRALMVAVFMAAVAIAGPRLDLFCLRARPFGPHRGGRYREDYRRLGCRSANLHRYYAIQGGSILTDCNIPKWIHQTHILKARCHGSNI